jgi:ABC-2 type transport system permease protein
MSTFKIALQIIWKHRLYLFIYIIGLGMIALISGFAQFSTSLSSADKVSDFVETRPTVAIIDRDGGDLGKGLADYLAVSSGIKSLNDTTESLQKAVATNEVDYIAIIPHGYTADFEKAVESGSEPPPIETVVSYTSGNGSMAQMQTNGYFGSVRTALLGGLGDDGLAGAVDHTVASAKDSVAPISVAAAVDDSSSYSAAKNGIGFTLKFASYPLFTGMTLCVALIIGVFSSAETRRRMLASPLQQVSGSLQQILACCLVGIVTFVLYFCGAIGVIAIGGGDLGELGTPALTMTFVSMFMYMIMSIACGYLLGQLGFSTAGANGFANVVGLAIMFLSGAALDPTLMTDTMQNLGKLTPGWWYCVSLDNAFGIGTATDIGTNVSGWANGLGVVAAFALALMCIGLAVGRFRRNRPAVSDPMLTQLAEMG